LYFPVLTTDWTANEELLLLEGIEMHGLGNWIDVSNHLSTKTAADCERHFFSVYVDIPSHPLPVRLVAVCLAVTDSLAHSTTLPKHSRNCRHLARRRLLD
jgi:hypothetical protein